MKIGIMGAMKEEIVLLLHALDVTQQTSIGGRDYITGTLENHTIIIAFSRWGKVAAASTATTMINHFNVEMLVFTGIAGAADPALNIGDIVVATHLVQHDMDVSLIPGMSRFEIPLLGISHFPVAPQWVEATLQAAQIYLEQDFKTDINPADLADIHVTTPKAYQGVIASGDQFIGDASVVTNLRGTIPGLMCVEMEGAAVAQVAYEYNVPCLVVRTMSDKADHCAIIDFPKFVESISSHMTCGIVQRLLTILPDELPHSPSSDSDTTMSG